MRQLTPDETLLGLLAAQARHGYELQECFHDPAQLGEVWNLSTSQLYAVLKRLEQQGLTTGSVAQAADAPPRNEYTLTEAGVQRLKAWLKEEHPPASVHCVRVEFLSRLYIARLLNLPTLGIVERQKRACVDRRNELLAQLNSSKPGIGLLTLELNIAQLDAIAHWIDRCELSPQPDEER